MLLKVHSDMASAVSVNKGATALRVEGFVPLQTHVSWSNYCNSFAGIGRKV